MRTVAVFLVVLALTGCVSTRSTLINPQRPQHVATTPNNVIFYSTADQVHGRYEEVALMNSRGDSIWRTEDAMLESMRESAAEVGANGIIMDAMSEPGAGAKVASFFFFGFDVAGRKDKAVAIYVFPH